MHAALNVRRILCSLALLVLVTAPGCGSAGTYIKHRIVDLSDVLDVKCGGDFDKGLPVGLGAKVELTSYVGGGLGIAELPHTREWYGRRSVVTYDQSFRHALLIGWDGRQDPLDEGYDATEWYQVVLPVNLAAIDHPETPPMLQRWRVGGEIILPFVMGGAYLNFGELIDFFAGFGNVDLSGDDDFSITDHYGEAFR